MPGCRRDPMSEPERKWESCLREPATPPPTSSCGQVRITGNTYPMRGHAQQWGTSMSKLEDYATRYPSVRMERRNGILQATLHTNGDSLRWGLEVHAELPDAFADIGRDPDNRIVILTGTGREFSGPAATPGSTLFVKRPSLETMNRVHWEAG